MVPDLVTDKLCRVSTMFAVTGSAYAIMAKIQNNRVINFIVKHYYERGVLQLSIMSFSNIIALFVPPIKVPVGNRTDLPFSHIPLLQ